MSILIDDLLKRASTNTMEQAKDSMWYIAKPMPYCSFKGKIRLIKDGLRVMMGKSFAVHFKEDE